MSNLANNIEGYLKRLLMLSGSGYIDIKRKELSNKFNCVPSQVNYVLETRFTLERGYLVESKRGGKGYVRIKKLDISPRSSLIHFLRELETGPPEEEKVRGFLLRLFEERVVSLRELKLMEAALEGLVGLEEGPLKEKLRRNLLREMLLVLLKFDY